MIYKVMFYGGIFFSIITFLVFIIMFFKMDIIDVIEDITGIKAKKEIEELKKKNKMLDSETDSLLIKDSEFLNVETDNKNNSSDSVDIVTDKIRNTKNIKSFLETEEGFQETNIANEQHGTIVLDENDFSTNILVENKESKNESISESKESMKFKIILDVMYVNTDEVI